MRDGEVDRRLREAARLSARLEAGARRPVDLSAEAVDRRLREVAEVSRACLALEAAGRAHRAAAAGGSRASRDEGGGCEPEATGEVDDAASVPSPSWG